MSAAGARYSPPGIVGRFEPVVRVDGRAGDGDPLGGAVCVVGPVDVSARRHAGHVVPVVEEFRRHSSSDPSTRTEQEYGQGCVGCAVSRYDRAGHTITPGIGA